VINEIMFKPPNINVTNDNSIDEYIELHNIASTNVPLFWVDSTNNGTLVTFTNGWKLDDAVSYQFPNTPVLRVNDYLLVVNFDPQTNATQLAAFRSKYGIPGTFTNIFGPYGGKLKNSGASIKLLRPDYVQGPAHPDFGYVPYIQVDKVNYSDSAPWPTNSDGAGASLQRRHRSEYGNDPINWGAQGPTPGRTNSFAGPISFTGVSRSGARVDMIFTAQQGQPYVVESQNTLTPGGPWFTVSNVLSTVTGPYHVVDTLFSPTSSRFYRARTTASP
jgi:hypothetical protein